MVDETTVSTDVSAKAERLLKAAAVDIVARARLIVSSVESATSPHGPGPYTVTIALPDSQEGAVGTCECAWSSLRDGPTPCSHLVAVARRVGLRDVPLVRVEPVAAVGVVPVQG